MPAINVARTDTFEQQRVKINQLGDQLFNVTSGGSDLAAGNIKLGDGTQTAPSLAFDSDATLGFYKPSLSTIGFVASSKKLFNIASTSLLFYKDLNIRQEKISPSGITFNDYGQNYDAGSYTNILLTGGTGSGALADIDVTEFVGTLTPGSGYIGGVYSGINLVSISGSGSGAVADFEVPGIEGQITNAGSAYKPGFYVDVPLTGGSGSGALAEITIVGDIVLSGSITNGGSGYTTGSYTDTAVFNVPTQTFVVAANGNTNFIIDGNASATLNLTKGNTYRFDVSDSTMSTHQLAFQLTGGGFIGSEFFTLQGGNYGTAGAFVDLVITDTAPSGVFEYDCVFHPGMTGVMNVGTGALGTFGRFALCSVTVDAGGIVTAFEITTPGVDYKSTDTVTLDPNSFNGGSGLVYTISSLQYNSSVDTITITDDGQGYLDQDLLGINDSDVGGGGGSGFEFEVNNTPGIPLNFVFQIKGTGYQTGDVLGLPGEVVGITTTLKSIVSNVTATLGATAQITVSSSAGIVPGMEVLQSEVTAGEIFPSSTVISVDSPTLVTLSDIPVSPGSATLEFRSLGTTEEITVSSTAGIVAGSLITQTAGTGTIGDVVVSSIIDGTTILLSGTPTGAGTATLTFTPPYGSPTTDLEYTVGNLGVIDTFSLTDGGIGYTVGDLVSVDPTDLTQPITYVVTVKNVQELIFPSTTYADGIFSVGDVVSEKAGSILSVTPVSSTTLLAEANVTYTNVSASGGSGSGATFDVVRDANGDVISVTITNGGGGFLYEQADQLVILGNAVGGVAPTDNLTINVDSATVASLLEVHKVVENGGFTTSILVDSGGIVDGATILRSGSPTEYLVDVASTILYRYFIDLGSGPQLTPDITLYSNSTYNFDISDTSNQAHQFAFSAYRDGSNAPSLVENLTTILSTTSAQITLSSTAGILPGMRIIEVTTLGGALIPGTTVESVDDANTITLSNVPLTAGTITLSFQGLSYVDGVSIDADVVTIKPSDTTPTLYYYDANGVGDLGGENNQEAQITINTANPKVFGSGFQLTVAILDTTDVVVGSISSGDLQAVSFTGTLLTIDDANVTDTLTSSTVDTTVLSVSTINSSNEANNITLEAANYQVNSDVAIGTGILLDKEDATIQTTGEIKTLNQFNSNDLLFINNAEISSATATDIELSAAAQRVTRITGTTALVIPSGANSDRPGAGIVSDGAIRFNTESNQYEGYSSNTTSWSSLGGVRDIDGNTYILAEESVGSNDNKLWFYNDSILSLRLTKDWMEFMNADAIRSLNTAAPAYTEWRANTLVTAGEYLKYASSIYFVVSTGTTATSGNEPSNTSGNDFTNGSATLRWHVTAVKDLLFSEIATVKVGSTLDTLPLSINGDLRLRQNVISTDTSDLLLKPNTGKKVVIDTVTSLVIPVGSENDKGSASTGSIRYNTTNQNFEGYNGAQWGSLGGVKDVDQNTYIIPETSPGANENILYFYNNNVNTLNVTETELRFEGINTITTPFDNSLEITTSTFTLDSSATTIDNTNLDRSVLSTSKQYLDLALSSGLNVDPVLRLDDQGDVYLNVGFGSGVFDGVKVFDKDLSTIEIAKYKIVTAVTELTKGGTESGATVLYDPAVERSSKVEVIAHNTSSGQKEFIELSVIDNGSTITFSEIGTLQTSGSIVDYTLDFNVQGNVRFNFSLASTITNTQVVNITVVSRVIKK